MTHGEARERSFDDPPFRARRCGGQRSQRRRVREIVTKLHNEIVAIGNEPSFRQKRLIDIGIVPVFDSPEQFAEYLNGRKLIHESGFQPR
jgi:hypothetical protein